MPTAQATLNNSMSSDAALQAYVATFRATMLAAGVVRVPDNVVTGQIDPNTVVRPAVTGLAGFEIYQFNDGLQTTKPIYLRVNYYVVVGGTAVAYHQFTVGTSVSSTGVLGGQLSSAGLTYNAQAVSQTLTVNASADRLWMMWGSLITPSSNNASWRVVLDRTRDENGVTTGDGYVWMVGNATSSSTTSPTQVVPFTGGVPTAWTNGSGFQEVNPLVPYFYFQSLSGTVVLTNAGSAIAICPFLCPVGMFRFALGAVGRAADFTLGQVYTLPLLGGSHQMIATYNYNGQMVELLPWE